MPQPGTLRTWLDDRGFGFIAPSTGGREVFVHVSAFPNDGSRPTVGESLTYELGEGKDGKPQAVRVYRQHGASRRPIPHHAARHRHPANARPSCGASAWQWSPSHSWPMATTSTTRPPCTNRQTRRRCHGPQASKSPGSHHHPDMPAMAARIARK